MSDGNFKIYTVSMNRIVDSDPLSGVAKVFSLLKTMTSLRQTSSQSYYKIGLLSLSDSFLWISGVAGKNT